MRARRKNKEELTEGEDKIHSLVARMREAGYRITAPRRSVLGVVTSASIPHTVREIAKKAHIGELSTVYRTLEELVSLGAVSIVYENSVAHYEMNTHHHDHVVCEKCGVLDHVPCTSPLPPLSLRQHGWHVRTHTVVWRGVCRLCRAT